MTECDSRIPQNRLPLEEQNLILRAFLCFYEKALNNSLLGQHKSVTILSMAVAYAGFFNGRVFSDVTS